MPKQCTMYLVIVYKNNTFSYVFWVFLSSFGCCVKTTLTVAKIQQRVF